ncbi:hypothetical protein RDI58_010106 [Solanum bulbocastanum]|uniref:DUF4283 domain-containing protein n=1 Tax=Solanum bulbocastanum TaxID=147425 RepID=A0AAN8TPV8_SOLBU
MAALPSPQPMAVGETNANPNTGRTYASSISENQQYSEKSLKPVILLHGEPTVVFDSKDIETFIIEENLKYALIANLSHGRPKLPNLRKILPQQLGFKGEFNIGLLESKHVLLGFTLKEDYITIFLKTSRSIKFVAVGQLLIWIERSMIKHDLVLQGHVSIRGIEKLIVELSPMVKLMSWSVKIILKEKNFKEIFVIISMLKELI